VSIEALNWAWRFDLKTHPKLLLLHFADYADREHRQCYPSANHTAQRCGMDARTVRRWQRELERLGLLSVIARPGRNNFIQLHLEVTPEQLATPDTVTGVEGAGAVSGVVDTRSDGAGAVPGGADRGSADPINNSFPDPEKKLDTHARWLAHLERMSGAELDKLAAYHGINRGQGHTDGKLRAHVLVRVTARHIEAPAL